MADFIRNHWRADLSATPGAPSAPSLLPRRFGTATAKVIPGGAGTAELEFSLDDPNDVVADPDSASWESWDPGPVNASTTRTLMSAVSAIRLKAYSVAATAQLVVSYEF